MKKKDESSNISSESKQIETLQKVVEETTSEQKDDDDSDRDDLEEGLNFKLNISSPLSPMPASPQQKEKYWKRGQEDDNKLTEQNSVEAPKEHIEEYELSEHEETTFARPLSIMDNTAMGRITPPPALLSPMPPTPAGSMTPVSIVPFKFLNVGGTFKFISSTI